MTMSEEQISPLSFVCKQNYSRLHSFFNHTALEIHFATSQSARTSLGGEL